MEIETLKDLKEALAQVPDKILDNFGIGVTEDGISLCTEKGDDEIQMAEYFENMSKKYLVLNDIGKLIDNIIAVERNEDYDQFDGYISSSNYIEEEIC